MAHYLHILNCMERSTRQLIGAAMLATGVAMAARKPKPYSFENRVVLITGGSRGLGLILARQFAEEGANLILCARSENELRRAADQVAALGAPVLTKVCDVGFRDQVRELIEFAIDAYGRIDVIVNNASIIQVGPAESMTFEDFEKAMAVNFWGTVNTTVEALPHLQEGARIMNVTSIGGEVAVPHLLPYTAAKFATVGFSEGLAEELARRKVFVTTIVPGLMRTGSFVNALFKGKQDLEMNLFSLGATMPVVSMDAERAARRMIEACRVGRKLVTIGAPWKLVRAFHGLFPNLTIKILGAVNFLLPLPVKGTKAEPGWMHRRGLANSPLTKLGDKAAARFNEA